jgi:hypothetical protein
MKKLTVLFAALSVFALSPRLQAQNLLGNPSLDDFPDPDVPPWTLTETETPTNPAVDSAELVDFGLADASNMGGSRHSGPLGLWLREFEGLFFPAPFPATSETNAVLTQTVPGSPNQTYRFTGWTRFEGNYSGGVTTLAAGAPGGARPSPTQTLFTMEFLDGSNSVIGAPLVTDLRNIAVNGGPWVQGVVQGLSPAGTANVRVTAEALRMVPNVDPAQSAFMDDFSLTAGVPEPGCLALAGTAIAGLALRRRK